MSTDTKINEQFSDSVADHYHFVLADWNASVRRDEEVIAKLVSSQEQSGPILDVACGIGAQSVALAALGYFVEGADISAFGIARPKREASVAREDEKNAPRIYLCHPCV